MSSKPPSTAPTSSTSSIPRRCARRSTITAADRASAPCARCSTARRSVSPTPSSSAASLRIVGDAGLPLPETQADANGYRVDAYWPELGLVVEADSLRYHRTAAQQLEDRRRDQAHAAAGLERLRVTRHQVRYEPATVGELLAVVIARLERVPRGPAA